MTRKSIRRAVALVVVGLGCVASRGVAQDVISERRHEFRHQQITVLETRTVMRDGTIRCDTRTPNGASVDLDAIVRREIRLDSASRGKLTRDLLDRAAKSGAGQPIEVAFWLELPDAPDFRLVLEAGLAGGLTAEDARRLAFASAERFVGPRAEAVAADLAAAGHELVYVGTAWPVVIARVAASKIASAAADVRINTAYHSADRWATENDNAQPTLRTPTVHDRGNTGKNSTIKVMVNDPGHVTTQNPYLPPVTLLNGGSAASHATSVAGNICSSHPTWFGGARELPILYSANGTGDTGAPPLWATAIQNGVSYGNCSWWNFKKGKIEFLDRFFDYTIRQFGVMMFKSTGNQGRTSTPYTTTPGNGYNVTNSGCYNDGDSHDWQDDAMASYSSYWDPAEGHEKPELASPGDGVRTTSTSSPWTRAGFGGTSSASPLTCGVATLLGTRDANLRARTYTLKAILMASAWHNVEGNAVLSEKDGAGGVHATAADTVVRDGQYRDGTFTSASFPGGMRDEQIQLDAGEETRVCLLWQSNANSSYSTDTLDMDLDITVLDPGNRVVASSANGANPFEIVAFTPAVTGTYTVRITRIKFQGTNEPYALVWSTREDMATADVQLSGSGSIGTTLSVTFRDRYHGGAAYAAAASFGTGPTPIWNGHTVPATFDGLFAASLFGAFPGFAGALNSSGTATANVGIPNLVQLRGIPVYFTMVSYRGSNAEILGTAPAAKQVIQ